MPFIIIIKGVLTLLSGFKFCYELKQTTISLPFKFVKKSQETIKHEL